MKEENPDSCPNPWGKNLIIQGSCSKENSEKQSPSNELLSNRNLEDISEQKLSDYNSQFNCIEKQSIQKHEFSGNFDREREKKSTPTEKEKTVEISEMQLPPKNKKRNKKNKQNKDKMSEQGTQAVNLDYKNQKYSLYIPDESTPPPWNTTFKQTLQIEPFNVTNCSFHNIEEFWEKGKQKSLIKKKFGSILPGKEKC
jgi:hypothetical protein